MTIYEILHALVAAADLNQGQRDKIDAAIDDMDPNLVDTVFSSPAAVGNKEAIIAELQKRIDELNAIGTA